MCCRNVVWQFWASELFLHLPSEQNVCENWNILSWATTSYLTLQFKHILGVKIFCQWNKFLKRFSKRHHFISKRSLDFIKVLSGNLTIQLREYIITLVCIIKLTQQQSKVRNQRSYFERHVNTLFYHSGRCLPHDIPLQGCICWADLTWGDFMTLSSRNVKQLLASLRDHLRDNLRDNLVKCKHQISILILRI